MYYDHIIKKFEEETNKSSNIIENLNENKITLRKNKNDLKIQRKRKYKINHIKYNNNLEKQHQFEITRFDLSFNQIKSYLESNNSDLISYCLREISIYFEANFPDIYEQKVIIEQKFLFVLLNYGNYFIGNNNLVDLTNVLNILVNIIDSEEKKIDYLNFLYSDDYFNFFNNCLLFVEKDYSKSIDLIYRKVLLILISMLEGWENYEVNLNKIYLESKFFSQLLKCYEEDSYKEADVIELFVELIVKILSSLNEEEDYSKIDIELLHKCLDILIKELYSTNKENYLAIIYKGINYLTLMNDDYKLNKKVINQGVTVKILKMKFDNKNYNQDKYLILKYTMMILANNLTASDNDCKIIYSLNIIDYYNNILEKFDDEICIVKHILNGISNIAVGSHRDILKKSIIWKESNIVKYLYYGDEIRTYFLKILKYFLYTSDYEIIKFIFNTKILEYLIFLFTSNNVGSVVLIKILKIIDHYLSLFRKELKETNEYLIIFHKFKELFESSETIIIFYEEDKKKKNSKIISAIEKRIKENYE